MGEVMGIRRSALSPVVATIILVAMAIVIGLVVALWAKNLMEGPVTCREEMCTVTGVIKKVGSKYILISTSDDKWYILMGPEEVLGPLSEIPLKVTIQGKLENVTIQVKRVEINIPLLGHDAC